MKAVSRKFLENLLATIGPSGYEDEASAVWAREAESFAQVRVDSHGNTVATLNPGGSPRVMLAGHVDELGFIVTHIDEEGFLYVAPVGGWDPQIPQGQRVWIRTRQGRVTGVFGKKPVHTMSPEDLKKVPKIEELWVDIGARNREEAAGIVEIGDPLVLAWGFEELRNGICVSRGIDDKTGAFVVLEALRLLSEMNPKAEVHAVATVQEEIGLRGAHTSTFDIRPDVAIAVDVTQATDHPTMGDNKKQAGEVKLGGGPVIARGPNVNPRLFEHLQATAKEKGIPYQVRGLARGAGNDANAMQLVAGAKAAGIVALPNRYMHQPVELIHLEDLENSFTLLAEAIAAMDSDEQFRPW